MDKETIEHILALALTEFPLQEIQLNIPKWIAVQKGDFAYKKQLFDGIKNTFVNVKKISDIETAVRQISTAENDAPA